MDYFDGDFYDYGGEQSQDEDDIEEELWEDLGWEFGNDGHEPCYSCKNNKKMWLLEHGTGVIACAFCLRKLELCGIIGFEEIKKKSDDFALELKKKKDEEKNNNNLNNIDASNGAITQATSIPPSSLNQTSYDVTSLTVIQSLKPTPNTPNTPNISRPTSQSIQIQLPHKPINDILTQASGGTIDAAQIQLSHGPTNNIISQASGDGVAVESRNQKDEQNNNQLNKINSSSTAVTSLSISISNNKNIHNIETLNGDIASVTPAPPSSLNSTSDEASSSIHISSSTSKTPPSIPTSDNEPIPNDEPIPDDDVTLHTLNSPSDKPTPLLNTLNLALYALDGKKSAKLDAEMRDSSINSKVTCHPPAISSDPKSIITKAPYLYLKIPIPDYKFPWQREAEEPPTQIEYDAVSVQTENNDALLKASHTPSPGPNSAPITPKQTSKNDALVNISQPPSNEPDPTPITPNPTSNNDALLKASHQPSNEPNLAPITPNPTSKNDALLTMSHSPSNKLNQSPITPNPTSKNDALLTASHQPSNELKPTSDPPSKNVNAPSFAALKPAKPIPNKDGAFKIHHPPTNISDLPLNKLAYAPSVTVFNPSAPTPNNDGVLNKVYPPTNITDLPSNTTNTPSDTAIILFKPTPNNDGVLNTIHPPANTYDPPSNNVYAPSLPTLNPSKPAPNNDGALNKLYSILNTTDLPSNEINELYPILNTTDPPLNNTNAPSVSILNPPPITLNPPVQNAAVINILNPPSITPNNDGALNINHLSFITSDPPSNKANAPSAAALNVPISSSKSMPSPIPSLLTWSPFLDASNSVSNVLKLLNASNLPSDKNNAMVNIVHPPLNVLTPPSIRPSPMPKPTSKNNTALKIMYPPSNVLNLFLKPTSQYDETVNILQSPSNTPDPPSNTPDPPPNTSLEFSPPSKPPERSKKVVKNDIDPRDRDKYKMDTIGTYGSGGGNMDPRDRDKYKMDTMGEYGFGGVDPRDRDKDKDKMGTMGEHGLSGGGGDPRDRDKKIGLAGIVDTVSLNQLNQANAESLARIVNYGSDAVEAVSLLISYGICGTEPRKNDAVDAVSSIQNMFNYYLFIWYLIAVVKTLTCAEQVASLYAIAALTKADGWYQMNDDEMIYIAYDFAGYGLNSSGDKRIVMGKLNLIIF